MLNNKNNVSLSLPPFFSPSKINLKTKLPKSQAFYPPIEAILISVLEIAILTVTSVAHVVGHHPPKAKGHPV